ncbi:hypothetical protein [Labrenzia sp. PHM005]|uniref:hypothetical protein n=1 Tax=Labrenzia sp. PHM005 TaxID=2590016 RepID=UPI0011404495|nr:hypothetical protein [Labrenzia sp. PHM005]QDG78638.1 hypothetical protein FJ695_23770 [Labrenzia sp. PHM005]
MAQEIWVSSVRSNYLLGNKLGIREKHIGQDWAPPQFEMGAPTEEHRKNVNRASQGEKLSREEFVEAAYVFDAKKWSRVKDLFWVDGFLAVKGKLAELLKDIDLGDGELVEFPIYEMDKTTRLPGPFYFLNFGSQKDCFLPEDSRNLSAGPINPKTGFRRWRAIEPKDEDIAVSASALGGPDLWVDPKFSGKIFMSGRLHDAIEAAKLKIDFRFAKTRILPE